MRRAVLLLVVLFAVVGTAASPASAAPQLTLTPKCDEALTPYGFVAALAGLPPSTQFGGTVRTEVFTLGPAFFRSDSSGGFTQPFAAGGPLGNVEVDVFVDLNENKVPDAGEAQLHATLERPCEEAVTGGTVVARGDSFLDFGKPFSFTLDARSGPNAENPSGTVVETIAGTQISGTVTCLRVRGTYASVGLALSNPPPGVQAAQVWFVSKFADADQGLVKVEDVVAAPTSCPPPGGGGFQVQNGSVAIHEAGVDTTPPTIRAPTELTVNATSPAGARVLLNVSASDSFDPAPRLECSPPRGSVFPIGTTSVRCVATDAAGNQASAEFPLSVKGGAQQLDDLDELVGTLGLDKVLAKRLRAEIHDARAAVGYGKLGRACRELGDLAQLIRRRAGGKLTNLEAGRLDYEVARIRAVLGCAPQQPPATQPRITLGPACDIPQRPYGIAFSLEGFPPNADVTSEVTITETMRGTFPFITPTDSTGAYGEVREGLAGPLGTVTVVAKLADGTVLATASLENPCLLERRRGSRRVGVPAAGR